MSAEIVEELAAPLLSEYAALLCGPSGKEVAYVPVDGVVQIGGPKMGLRL